MKTISLCIPSYNAAWCLPKLLQSAKNQCIPFDEILVYDDCSTDNTIEIAQFYGAKVIEGTKNEGCSYGKNRLAEYSSCDWIHFHDADDVLLPNFTKIAHQWIQKSNSPDIVLLNFEYRDYKNNDLLGQANYDRNVLISDTMKFVITHKLVNFALCKRESFMRIGGFILDKNVLYNEDRAFYVKAATAGLKFDYEPVKTCINYKYEQSMSLSNQLKCAYAHYEVSKRLAGTFGKVYRAEIAEGLWDNATIAASLLDWKLTKANLKLAISLNGRMPKKANPLFKMLCLIDPLVAYWVREKSIRIFKRYLR